MREVQGMSLSPLLDDKWCLASLNLATYYHCTMGWAYSPCWMRNDVLSHPSIWPPTVLSLSYTGWAYSPCWMRNGVWYSIIPHSGHLLLLYSVHSRPQYSTSVPSVPLSSQVNRTVRFALIQNTNNKNYFKKLFYISLILKLDCKPDFYNFYFIYLIFKLQYNSA